MSEYIKQANDLLASMGVTFKAERIGATCPTFCDCAGTTGAAIFPRKNHIHGAEHAVTFTRGTENKKGKVITFRFWNSYRDEYIRFAKSDFFTHNAINNRHRGIGLTLSDLRKDVDVHAYDVLACLTKYNPGSFGNFCSEYGYDDDSIKAKKTWEAVIEEFEKMESFFSREELEQLQEVH